jgi:hypothetical protein
VREGVGVCVKVLVCVCEGVGMCVKVLVCVRRCWCGCESVSV